MSVPLSVLETQPCSFFMCYLWLLLCYSSKVKGEGNGNPLQYSCLENPKSHGRRSLVGCNPWGREESDTTEQLHFSLSCIGEGNGNPLQRSCLENPRDGGAWGATVYGVSQSQTRLKRLRSSSSCRLWKQSRYPSTDEWIKLWYIYTMEYCCCCCC